MGTEDWEEEPLLCGFIPASPKKRSGEVYIFWSTGHETMLYSGDEATALKEYRKALTFSKAHLDQLSRQPSKIRVREHHVVELLVNKAWDIDPIRTRKELQPPKTWEVGTKKKFTGKISTVRRSSGYNDASVVSLR